MSNIRESEILHVNEIGREVATSYDPGAFSEETITTILNNQITSPNPLEIHCYVVNDSLTRGVFHTIESTHFIDVAKRTEPEKEQFINACLGLIKGLNTVEVIFAEPLKNPILTS